MAWTYPHINIGVRENKPTVTVTTEATPLHAMITFLMCEKGPENIPVGGDGGTLPYVFGSGTFDNTLPYFKHQTMFAMKAMSNNRVFVVRVVDDAATHGSLVLSLTLTAGAIPQYQRDSNGALILDGLGDPQPILKDTTPVTEPGYTGSWSVRALTAEETYDGVKPTTVGTGSTITSYTYPIIAIQATYRGAAANRYGFRLWSAPGVDVTQEARVNSALYRFQPVYLSSGTSGNVNNIADKFSALYSDVSLKSTVVDPNTAQNLSLNSILRNNYPSSGSGALDFVTHVYSDSITAIGNLLSAVAPSEFPSSADPFLINIVSGTDIKGNSYKHFVLDSTAAALLNSTNILYMQGGSDGDTSVTKYESLVADFITSENNVDFLDQFRFPFTHFYDSGYSLQNKFSIIALLGLRDGLYLQMSTHDASASTPNTQAQDQSVLSALTTRMRTYAESTDYGTATFRGSVDMQAGHLATTTGYTDGWVATTMDVLTKNCLYYSGTYVSGTPKGRPNNEVSLFSDLSWTTSTQAQKQANWTAAGNVVSYADENVLFYADRRTIFTDDTGLLSDETFGHYVIFVKKIARTIWTRYVGREEPLSELKDSISKDIDREINRVFGSRLSSKTTVMMTDADLLNGFSCTVVINLIGFMPNRIWTVEIPVSRSTDVTSSTTAAAAV